jgi:hypothetical protein
VVVFREEERFHGLGTRDSQSTDFSRFLPGGDALGGYASGGALPSRSKKQQIPHCASRNVRSEANVKKRLRLAPLNVGGANDDLGRARP